MNPPAVVSISALLAISLASAATSAPAQASAPPRQPVAAATYGKLPLSFEVNQGQTAPSVQFLSHGQGYTLFLRPGEAVLALRGAPLAEEGTSRAGSGKPASTTFETSIVRMELVGAHPNAPVTREDKQITKTNYFLGNDPAKWRTDIANYGRLRYHSVYDGIDLVYYGNQRQLEHDFVVAPGGDPARIALALKGAKKLRIDPATGDLVISSGHADLRLLKPVTYQESSESGGQRTQIPSSYKLLAGRRVGFRVGRYNHTRPLVIDPILVYSTYLGGSAGNPGDQGNGIAVDSNGNAVVVGSTTSLDFPTTTGAYQTTNKVATAGNGGTAFVAKFNASGSALLYSTFLGGSGESSVVFGPSDGDAALAIALDSTGNAYVTGWTRSADFPTSEGAYQTVNKSFSNGLATGFVTKLNATGDALIYSTYLGGTITQQCFSYEFVPGQAGLSIAVDGQGSAYVAGATSAADFPVTAGAFQQSYPASSLEAPSGFVTKLSPDGTALVYSTYLGGSGAGAFCYVEGDEAYAIAIDSAGDAYVAGGTASADFPVTAGALKTAYTGGNAFVTKLNSTGTAELYSTYLGGSGRLALGGTNEDYASALAVDSAGNAYVSGFTSSSDFPVTSGVLYPTFSDYNDEDDGFVAKLNAAGSALEYATFLPVAPAGLAIDGAGSAYVTGSAGGAAFPSTPDAVVEYTSSEQSPPYGAFVAKLNPSATGLEYSTVLASRTGFNNSFGNALALDAAGNLFVTGGEGGNYFPTTSGAYQTSNRNTVNSIGNGEGYNAFVTKLALAGETASHGLTNIALSPSSALMTYGQPGSLSATLIGATGSATPTGTVAIDAGTYSDVATLDESGVATWTTTALPPGAYTASAYYQGDATHLSSSVGGTYPGDGVPFRIVGPPAILAGTISCCGRTPTYGQAFGPLQVFVTDSSGYALGGIPVKFSSSGLTFSPSTPETGTPNSGFWGVATTVPTATKAGLLTATATVKGVSTPYVFSINVAQVPLTVTVQPVFAARPYGSANPTFTYAVKGLINGDTVTVTPSTTATASSPVGTYPVTAAVSGPALANYQLTVKDAVLHVTPALLEVWPSPATRGSNYGNPIPPLTGFAVSGLVNGDTQAAAITGAPILSTTATSTSPPGIYPINLSLGTLVASANYSIWLKSGSYYIYPGTRPTLQVWPAPATRDASYGSPFSALTGFTITGFTGTDTQAASVTGAPVLTTTATSTSPVAEYPIDVARGTLASAKYNFQMMGGRFFISKAPLTATATSFTVAHGQPIPGLTYSVAGFVNGDTQAGVVTGAPVLTTTATSTSPPGQYPVTITAGTLAAQNYSFTLGSGVITITP
jgi:hypothetical protein